MKGDFSICIEDLEHTTVVNNNNRTSATARTTPYHCMDKVTSDINTTASTPLIDQGDADSFSSPSQGSVAARRMILVERIPS
ncbi:hypothetical protein E2C01_012510 [Portunus trituberculatus]|uniref:Uncharacterized protein n=1 Tax=Portunus trituberculatus TaxID=210409 RepID=A0A5B7DDU9_PORTR|nr:hypothetical protein [Portunus trituberculatus]